ncbi:hypothetical protein BDR04DRAFT_1121026 [Suillus decipiens]|nr:hypothetical protein BDR04DRAFT_1121026 [Suillus decipiens]
MAHHRRVTFESSSSSEPGSNSDFSLASSRKTSPIPPAENSAPSIEPLKGTKRKRELSDSDNDNEMKGSKRPSPQEDVSKDNEEPSHPEYFQDPGETCTTRVQRVVITARINDFQAIHATDLTLGLRRIPAGFHVVVKTDGAEFQTSNKPIHVDQAVIEWNELILLVYASFELGPMLCHGEVLRTFEISIEELLDRSENSHPIVFQPKLGDVVSPCTSLFMTLEQRLLDENDVSVLCPPTTVISDNMHALVLTTDAGHHLFARYCRTHNSRDLDQSIKHFERASDLCSMDHPCRPAVLFNLAAAKFVSCQTNGRYLDLDIPVALFQDALDLRPIDADVAKELLSEVVGVCHTNSHIYRATLYAMETFAQHPVGSAAGNDLGPERPAGCMLPLSPNQLADRVEQCFRIDDPQALDEVISLHYDALEYYNTMHDCRGQLLCNLGAVLATRFKRRGGDEDLDQAIALHREALALHPVGHPDRSSSLNNLAVQLSTRFHHRGNGEDLDQAIALQREALALRPVSHPDQSMSLNNLAVQLSTRFDHRGNGEDLNESRENLCCALNLLTKDDPRRPLVHYSLAKVHLLFHWSGLDGTGPGEDTNSLNAAMHHHKAAAKASLSSRHNAMKDFPRTLAIDAASCALRSGDITRLRTPVDSLQTRGDHAVTLMKRFRDLSSLLDKPSVRHPEGSSRVDVEAEATHYRRLVKDWNGVVAEIRKIEGFSRFLLPPLFSDLQDAARHGPIIVLIASTSSCDAIIIPHEQPPTHIQLPINFEKLLKLVIALQEAIGKDAGPKGKQRALITALRELWDNVVCPVVEILGGFAQRGSRIWWCPISFFNFLPLHAAGEYRASGESLSQQYISSYTLSLTALIRARRSQDKALLVPFAAIGQNCPAGHSSILDSVEPELELVRSLLPHSPTVSFTKVMSIDAMRSRALVLCALRDNSWLHFACHGEQNYDEPFNSAFLMRDQPLSLLDITQIDLSCHQFAFLSACETAVGDFRTPDEVIHLAAGLRFAGVKSVIGTLWKVNDSTV